MKSGLWPQRVKLNQPSKKKFLRGKKGCMRADRIRNQDVQDDLNVDNRRDKIENHCKNGKSI